MLLTTPNDHDPEHALLGNYRRSSRGDNAFALHGAVLVNRILADVGADIRLFGLENQPRDISPLIVHRSDTGAAFRRTKSAGRADQHVLTLSIKRADKPHVKAKDFQRLVKRII